MDAQLGRVLDALERGPNAGSTAIILWGDHGFHLGEKMHWRKGALWEVATRVPLLVDVPGVTRPGSKSPRTVSLMDLYPTVVELAGVAPNPAVDARSLVPLLANPTAPWDFPVLTTLSPGNHAVRSERWRYIRYDDGGEELYDHDADPHEWTNLASDARWDDAKRMLGGVMPKTSAPER
jgi:arylsulfatase A-like enzyme